MQNIFGGFGRCAAVTGMLLAAFALAGCESAEDQEIRALIDEIAAIQEQTIAAMEASASAKDEEARERVVGNESWSAEVLASLRAEAARNQERAAAQRAEQLEDSRRGGREGLTKLHETLASGDWGLAYPREMARMNGSALAFVTSLRDRAERRLQELEAIRDRDVAWRERAAEAEAQARAQAEAMRRMPDPAAWSTGEPAGR